MSQRLITGIKPTGDIHIGNYFGVMHPLLQLQEQYESFVFIADLHALNQIHDRAELKQRIFEIAAAYLAIGLDPERVTLFRQSDISAHAELCQIFNSITSMGLLERAHAYKDALAKQKSINVGTFDYPVLMAADILLYQPDIVPVGNDQQQHVEIMSDIAKRFHHLFGPAFKIPTGHISEFTGTVPGLDGQKMSKSYNNVIGLFDAPEVLRKKVMSIVTDSAGPTDPKNPETDAVFAFHKLFSIEQLPELAQRYKTGQITYKESKDILLENVTTFLAPMRDQMEDLLSRPEYVWGVLEEGKQKAAPIAEQTLQTVKQLVGL